MKIMFKFFRLMFILFVALPRVYSLDDCHTVKNKSLLEYVQSSECIRSEIDKLKKKNDYYCNHEISILPDISIFVINKFDDNEAFILIPIYDNREGIIKEAVFKISAKNILEIISLINKNQVEFKNFLNVDKKIKFMESKCTSKFLSLLHMKDNLGLKNYIDFEKDGRVYYTVPSEDRLDYVHMIYESKDGKERKEFVFTKSGIIPIEDTIGWQIQNGWNKFRNFFSFSTKHEEVKNEGYDYVDEHTKLKEKIY